MDNYSLFSYFSLICRSVNLPTLLTLFRFFLIPFICFAIMTYSWDQALLLFSIAAITDVLDGALARLTNSETTLGAYLDPLADKCLVLFSFWSISMTHFTDFSIPIWFNIILFIKELLLVIVAAYFSMLKNNIKIKPSILGKGANFFQSACLIMLFFAGLYEININQFLNPILFFIIMISLWALLHYLWTGYKELSCEQ